MEMPAAGREKSERIGDADRGELSGVTTDIKCWSNTYEEDEMKFLKK